MGQFSEQRVSVWTLSGEKKTRCAWSNHFVGRVTIRLITVPAVSHHSTHRSLDRDDGTDASLSGRAYLGSD